MPKFDDIIIGIYVWSYRASILLLTIVAVASFKKKKTFSKSMILLGLSLILAGIVIDLSTWQLLKHRVVRFYKLSPFMDWGQLIIAIGTSISVIFCTLTVFTTRNKEIE